MTTSDWLQVTIALVGWLVIGGLLADLVYFDALSRGRTPEGWAVGTFFSGFVGLVYIIVVARRTPRRAETTTLRAMGRLAARDHVLGRVVPPSRAHRILFAIPPTVVLIVLSFRHATD
jgi:hypothetical protein